MQYLAKVEKKSFLGGAELRLIAQHTSDTLWERVAGEKRIEVNSLLAFEQGMLVIVNISSTHQVSQVEDAVPWVLTVIDQYLSQGITPEELKQEIERAERWRQSLTLKSQEIDRRALETAARRDEIQELEQNLKQDREALEMRQAELESLERRLNQKLSATWEADSP